VAAVQALSTIVLVIITIWYTYKTHVLSNVSEKQLELFTTPYVTIERDIELIVSGDGKNLSETTDFIQFFYSVKNVGKVPIQFIGMSEFNGEKSKSANDESVILYPDQSLKHHSKSYRIPNTKPTDIIGTSKIEIIYWALNSSSKKYYFSRHFRIVGNKYEILNDAAGMRNSFRNYNS